MRFTRRGILLAAGVGGLAGLTGMAVGAASATPAGAPRPQPLTAGPALSTRGTTVESVSAPEHADPHRYARLVAAGGWPTVVREELTAGSPDRDDRREGLVSFVQVTDLHLIDAESPARIEDIHDLIPSMHRPQEALGLAGSAALVRRINALRRGPYTGGDLAFVVTTGDNTDNHELAELEWFLTALSGGTAAQRTGDPDRYEGVQDGGDPFYWHPDRALDRSAWTAKGFPEIPGLLTAAGAPLTSPGLSLPWYCTFGNHDDSVQGSLADAPAVAEYYTAATKVTGRDRAARQRIADSFRDPRGVTARELFGTGTLREITPDERRRPFTPAEFVAAHFDPRYEGAGPIGHGFTDANRDGRDLFYTFPIAEGVTGISLDTTTMGGRGRGSLGAHQFAWLERTLRAGSSRYWTPLGGEERQATSDELFVVFSHHPSHAMDNPTPDPRRPDEPRLLGPQVLDLLHRYPNVIAWINGHSHRNAITPHPGPSPERGFWEINTASHVDAPQLARVIELADNRDGTLSLFTTLIESDAPARVEYDDFTPAGLASIYRELAFNDLNARATAIGEPHDRNAELLLVDPRR
ncbi:TIGR03767 family metallophosphoesterase [Microbacterium petrolearium]